MRDIHFHVMTQPRSWEANADFYKTSAFFFKRTIAIPSIFSLHLRKQSYKALYINPL